MSKYADIEQIKKTIRVEWVKYIPMDLDLHIAFVLGKVAEVPTIDIVHCKDCKWYGHIGCAIQIVDDMDRPSDNDYCSYGEHKESEEE